MKKVISIMFCVSIGCVGLISAVLAFAGEVTKIKSSDVKMVGKVCDYPKTSAWSFGFLSLLLLSLAHITLNVCNQILYCCGKNRNEGETPWVCFIFSWVTCGIALYMLFVAVSASDLRYHPDDFDYCYILKPGIFSAAGVLILVTVALGITCHVLLSPSDLLDLSLSLSWRSFRIPHPIPRFAITQPQPPLNNLPVVEEEKGNQNCLLPSNPAGTLLPSYASQENENCLLTNDLNTLPSRVTPQENQNWAREKQIP